MALTSEHHLAPWVPLPADASWPDVQPDIVKLVYDPPTDTMFADLLGTSLPGIVWPIERDGVPYDGLSLKIDDESDRIVAVMVEGFLRFGVIAHRSWLALAPHAGVPIEVLRERGDPTHIDVEAVRRDVAVSSFLADARAAWEDAVRAEAAAGGRG